MAILVRLRRKGWPLRRGSPRTNGLGIYDVMTYDLACELSGGKRHMAAFAQMYACYSDTPILFQTGISAFFKGIYGYSEAEVEPWSSSNNIIESICGVRIAYILVYPQRNQKLPNSLLVSHCLRACIAQRLLYSTSSAMHSVNHRNT